MPDPKMPDRSVPAANADVVGDDARMDGTMEELTEQLDQDGTPRQRGQVRSSETGEARPGKDENQAGFLKDKDTPGA